MKRLIQILIWGTFLISCTEISYKEPQPSGIKNLEKVPSKLQGKYLVSDGEGQSDTLLVLQNGYRIGNEEEASLSDSLVLKYYKGYYFLSVRENYAWYLRVVKRQKNGDLLYLAMETMEREEDRKALIEKLSKETPVYESNVDDKTFYIIDPSPGKLIELIKKGHFKEQTFSRIR